MPDAAQKMAMTLGDCINCITCITCITRHWFPLCVLCTTEPLVRSVRCSVQYLIQYRSIANKGWPALNCMAPQKFIASVAEAESHCCCVHNSTDYSLAHYSLSHTRALALSLTSPCPASIQPLVRKSPQTRRLY